MILGSIAVLAACSSSSDVPDARIVVEDARAIDAPLPDAVRHVDAAPLDAALPDAALPDAAPDATPPSAVIDTVDISACVNPIGMTVDNGDLWIGCAASGTALKVDLTTDTVLDQVTVAYAPRGLTSDGSNVWTASQESAESSKIDETTDTVLDTITLPTSSCPTSAIFDGTNVWISDQCVGQLAKIDPINDVIIGNVDVGMFPTSLAFDGTDVWTATLEPGNVVAVDPTTDTVVATVSIVNGNVVNGLFLTADDDHNLWVASFDTMNVSKVDATTHAVTGIIDLTPIGPNGIVFGAGFVWITDGGGSVRKLDPVNLSLVETLDTASANNIAFDGTHVLAAGGQSLYIIQP